MTYGSAAPVAASPLNPLAVANAQGEQGAYTHATFAPNHGILSTTGEHVPVAAQSGEEGDDEQEQQEMLIGAHLFRSSSPAAQRSRRVTPSDSQLSAFFLLGCTRGGSPGILG